MEYLSFFISPTKTIVLLKYKLLLKLLDPKIIVVNYFKGIVHPKMKTVITHPHVVPNP